MRRPRVFLLSLLLVIAASAGLGLPTGVLADTTYATCPSFSTFKTDVQAITGSGTITFTAANCALTATEAIVTMDNSTVTINGNGLTLSGGTAGSPGAFDLIEPGTDASLTLDHTTLAYGSYGINQGSGIIELTNSTIEGNRHVGVYQDSGTITLFNSAVSSNEADGINQDTGTITLTNSAIDSNDRGGIYQDEGTITLTNSTIADNQGDGINHGGSTIVVTSSTIDGNGGFGMYAFAGTTTLTATLLAHNGDKNCDVPSMGDQGYNLSDDTNCGFGATGSQNSVSDTNLNLGSLGNFGGLTPTIPLLPGSIAIDAIPVSGGNCVIGETNDQRGVARPQGSGCDIGAYEAVAFDTVTAPADVSAFATDSTIPLSATVTVPFCPVPYNVCAVVNEGTVAFSVTDSSNNPVGADAQGSVSNGSASATFTPSSSLLPGAYTITASYHDPNGIFRDSQGTSTLIITAPASTSQTSLFVLNFRRPSIEAELSAGRGGGVSGFFAYNDGSISLQRVHLQSLVVTGHMATLFGTAILPNGTSVAFRLDASQSFAGGRVRLQLSNGYESGWRPVMLVSIGTSKSFGFFF